MDFATSDAPEVQAQLDRLAALSLPQGRFGLETITALLAYLGNPHKRLPPSFHIAGTNGKGSTCAFLRAMLEAAGHRVHVFSSPHLVRFNERIRLAGRLIEDEALAAVLAEVLDAAQAAGLAPSFFEVTTAAAFLSFARTPGDACVIEVGLGGRFDASNVLEQPAACGIASLGIDHEAFLLSPDKDAPQSPFSRIAFEKAGIAKRAAPLVTLDYTQRMNEEIAAQAAAVDAPLLRQRSEWRFTRGSKALFYGDRRGRIKLPLPRMMGAHQAKNAALAAAMIRHQTAIDVPEAALAAGVERAHWPARLQLLGQGPLTALLPQATACWLDGGHNRDAGAALSKFFRHDDRPIHLVIGMLANKNPGAIVLELQGRLASVTVVPVPGHECHPVEAFTPIPLIPAPCSAGSIEAALRALKVDAAKQQVLIAGSLYLAGEVLRLNQELPD